jgi:dihydrofolate reductase
MKIISHVVAASTNNGIGKNGQLLWHLPNDLKFFKNTTWGMPVIMGRKTFESVNKPLPGRINIVVSSNEEWNAEGVVKASTIEDAYIKAEETNCKEWFIIGGGEIYKQTMNKTNRIYITRVHADLDADTYYPAIDESIWELKHQQQFPMDEKHAFPYTFETWVKR